MSGWWRGNLWALVSGWPGVSECVGWGFAAGGESRAQWGREPLDWAGWKGGLHAFGDGVC